MFSVLALGVNTAQIAAGAVTEAKLTLADNTTGDVSSSRHGLSPKSPADATKFLNGDTSPAYAAVKESDLAFTDVTSNNVSVTKHGFAPKAPNDSSRYLDGTGAYSTPPGSGALVLLESHTAANSGELLFTSFLNAAYEEYEIHLVDIRPGTDTATLFLRCSTDGGAIYDGATVYQWAWFVWITATSTGSGGQTSDSQISLIQSMTATANWGQSARFTFTNPGGANYKNLYGQLAIRDTFRTDFQAEGLLLTATYRQTAAVNALRFWPSVGNIASGTIRIYGIKK